MNTNREGGLPPKSKFSAWRTPPYESEIGSMDQLKHGSAAMKVTLLAIDTSGIQSYVYATRYLREIIGASYLVRASTQEWPRQIIVQEMKITDDRSLTSAIANGTKVQEVFSGEGMPYSSLHMPKTLKNSRGDTQYAFSVTRRAWRRSWPLHRSSSGRLENSLMSRTN